tara:strand:- start:62 stop:244 length:183 start_codon:yes stop_codon:yes gene_type:complete
MTNLQITFTQEELENLRHLLMTIEMLGALPKSILDKYDLDGDKISSISTAINNQIIYCVK